MGRVDGESGRVGEWETGRVGDWESGRVGEWKIAYCLLITYHLSLFTYHCLPLLRFAFCSYSALSTLVIISSRVNLSWGSNFSTPKLKEIW